MAGVPLAAPPSPERGLHSLPATLCTQVHYTIGDCSKAPGVFPSRGHHPASSRGSQFHRASPQDSLPVVTPFMRSGTYPERNCATFGPSAFIYISWSPKRLDLIFSQEGKVGQLTSFLRVWRKVSEDICKLICFLATFIFIKLFS